MVRKARQNRRRHNSNVPEPEEQHPPVEQISHTRIGIDLELCGSGSSASRGKNLNQRPAIRLAGQVIVSGRILKEPGGYDFINERSERRPIVHAELGLQRPDLIILKTAGFPPDDNFHGLPDTCIDSNERAPPGRCRSAPQGSPPSPTCAAITQRTPDRQRGSLSPTRSANDETSASSENPNPACGACTTRNSDACSSSAFSSFFIPLAVVGAALFVRQPGTLQPPGFRTTNFLAERLRFVALAPVATTVLRARVFRFSDSIAHGWECPVLRPAYSRRGATSIDRKCLRFPG